MQNDRAPQPTPSRGDLKPVNQVGQADASRRVFLGAALNMSWQLAVAVLLPVVGGAELGKKLGAPVLWTLIGLAVAIIASGAIMWRTVQMANSLPVPKLTAAQRRAVQKSYEEDDD